MRAQFASLLGGVLSLVAGSGCAVVGGHERALRYTGDGLEKEIVQPGRYPHWPWNHYIVYDLRWDSHEEDIHIHSRDGLHMDIRVVAVVRPNPNEIYQLDTEVGPDFYNDVVRPAVFAAARDAAGLFGHLEIATQTHQVEEAIHRAMLEHLQGKHVELSEVAIQHFDLPPEVEKAANHKAEANQQLAAKAIELDLAKKNAEIEQEKKRGTIESQGLERKLRAEQELSQAEQQIRIEAEKRKADLEKVHAEAEAEHVRAETEANSVRVRAEAEAHAIRVKAKAERDRIQAQSQNLSPAYVKIQALESLAKAMSGSNSKIIVMPTGKDGLPAYFNPFLNPFGTSWLQGGGGGGTESASANTDPSAKGEHASR